MPRAFLIKAKKEKKKEDDAPSSHVQVNRQFSNGISDPHSNDRIVCPSEDQLSPPTHTKESPVRLHVKRKHSHVTASAEEREIISVPRLTQTGVLETNRNVITESPLADNAIVPRKTRKRSPKKTVVYYYKAKQDARDGISEKHVAVGRDSCLSKDVPLEGKSASMHQRNIHNYVAANSKRVTSQGNPNCGYHFKPPTHSTNCQEKSTRFEYEKAGHQESAKPFNYAESRTGKFSREKREIAPTAGNIGLDNVKIVEVHSIGQKMDIVYPNKSGTVPTAPVHHGSEEYRCNVSSANVPASDPPARSVQRKEPTPAQTSAPSATPVVHYLPVYAIPSSQGVQYQAVPGAAILEKVPGVNNLYSPVGKNGEAKPQPAYPQPAPPAAKPQPPPQSQAPPVAPPQLQVQGGPTHTQHHMPHPQPQGPVIYQPRMMSNPTAAHPVQPTLVQPGYPPQLNNPPMIAAPYPPPDTRVIPTQTYPPQAVAQAMPSPPYVVTKSEPVSPQQLSAPNHSVATTQSYPVSVQTVAPHQPQHYQPQTQTVPGQQLYPSQEQKFTQPPMYPPQYQSAPNQTPYPLHVVAHEALPYPPVTQQVAVSQPTPPPPPPPPQAAAGPVISTGHPYPAERPAQPYYPPQNAVQYPPEKSSSMAIHYYPVNKPPSEQSVVQQYPDQKAVHLPSPPYPVESVSQPPTPQYTPDGKEQQKFLYAPPPPDFMRSPVYRVPVTEAPQMVQQSPHSTHPPSQHSREPLSQPPSQPLKGAKRRKTAMPHREIRDSSSPSGSYPQHSSSPGSDLQCNEKLSKSPGHNPALNKSSCVITPPGSPHEEEDGSYTVVMRDYGIQAGPPTEQGTWTVKVESTAPRVYITEKEALAHAYSESISEEEDEYEEEEEEGDYNELDDTDETYSPTQKENRSPSGFQEDGGSENHLSRKGRRRNAKYTCKFCHKGFQWYSHLTSHERTHTGEKPFKCPECNRAFTRADGLQCHMLVHNKKRPFKCDYCNKGFNDNTSLEKHTYSHTGVKPFKCEYCGRAFSDSQSIEKHLLVHIGTKPYKCQFCVRSFNDSQMLVRHIRSHTGEKPFKCQHCQMAFSKQSALVIHTRVHTGEKPYQCPHCSKCFSISGNLQRHILIHTGERPYQCSKCPKAFNNPSHLSRHISKLHAPQPKPEGVVDNRPGYSAQGNNTNKPVLA